MLELEFENVLESGVKKYRIVRARSYRRQELPAEYVFGEGAYCYLLDSGKVFVAGYRPTPNDIVDGKRSMYESINVGYDGDVITQATLNKVLAIVRVAGPRLHEINKKIRQLEQEWAGKHWSITV